jgi:hypothetical protein
MNPSTLVPNIRPNVRRRDDSRNPDLERNGRDSRCFSRQACRLPGIISPLSASSAKKLTRLDIKGECRETDSQREQGECVGVQIRSRIGEIGVSFFPLVPSPSFRNIPYESAWWPQGLLINVLVHPFYDPNHLVTAKRSSPSTRGSARLPQPKDDHPSCRTQRIPQPLHHIVPKIT